MDMESRSTCALRLSLSFRSTGGVPTEPLGFCRDLMQKNLIHGPQSQQVKRRAAKQLYVTLGTCLASAALLGVDTCPIGASHQPTSTGSWLWKAASIAAAWFPPRTIATSPA